MSWKSKGVEPASKNVVSRKFTILMCIGCFCAGMFFSGRYLSFIPLYSFKPLLSTFLVDHEACLMEFPSRSVVGITVKAPRIEWFGKILLCSIPLVMRFMDVHDETLGLDTPVPHFGSHLDEAAFALKSLYILDLEEIIIYSKFMNWKFTTEYDLNIHRMLVGIMWTVPEVKSISRTSREDDEMPKLISGCDQSNKDAEQESKDLRGEVSKSHHAIRTMDKTISSLEMELAAARAAQESVLNGSPVENIKVPESNGKRKYLMVIGINTAFSSRKRRDSIRDTWMPQGDKRKKLEEEKGIIVRFVIGHSATSGGILDRAIEAEDKKHGDFLRLEHVEGYLELSAKTKIYFATAVALWDADFYVKVDDDVHVNIATLGATLARQREKSRVYIGCMKSGPVLARKGVRYHEPEYWKFGEEGNKYFRHATGQLYAISKDLATYISINQHVLHKYANEDVSLGSWFIGLDVEHIDDRRLCCGTPPGMFHLWLFLISCCSSY
ncbi:hypothetical protein FEM48_Zijuj01G0232600 [Ziziphus jujuba var. spinosa]|uniref:Hexosyltransferase n=1 Tax=Ziziphus jujuba var. spinosa TaxID=714518 RepID=A0A978W447_ZIZJJ|nr:hypothetical protein FEM48_Zijuj01G0232600 [Ziziphus jujuba var. spinosa]